MSAARALSFDDNERRSLARAVCPCGHRAEWHSSLIGCNAEEWEEPECDCRFDWLDATTPTLERILSAHVSTERERIAAAVEVREFATGLNWKARDAYATAKQIARAGDAR